MTTRWIHEIVSTMTSWLISFIIAIKNYSLTPHHSFMFILELSLLSIILLIVGPLPLRKLVKSLWIVCITLRPSHLREIHLMLLHKLWSIIIKLLKSPSSIINRLINCIEIIMTVLHSQIIFIMPLFVIVFFRMMILLVIRRSVILPLIATSMSIKLRLGVK